MFFSVFDLGALLHAAHCHGAPRTVRRVPVSARHRAAAAGREDGPQSLDVTLARHAVGSSESLQTQHR